MLAELKEKGVPFAVEGHETTSRPTPFAVVKLRRPGGRPGDANRVRLARCKDAADAPAVAAKHASETYISGRFVVSGKGELLAEVLTCFPDAVLHHDNKMPNR